MSKVDPLQALLGAEIKSEKDVYIKRLDTFFKIKSISGEEMQEITDAASTYQGTGLKRVKITDEIKLSALLIVKGCVNPNFANKELLEKYGAVSAEEVVLKALRAGEIAKLGEEIMKLSGFDEDDDEVINEIKN